MTLANLGAIEDKYLSSPDPEIILNDEVGAIPGAIQETLDLEGPPGLVFADATAVQVQATADCPARLVMCGIPNIMNPKTWVDGGLSDGRYRAVTSAVNMDFDNAADHLGIEKASQWSAVFAIAGDADTTFTLLSIPWLRVKAQATKTISLGTNLVPATGIGYGTGGAGNWETDSLAGYILYFMTGASKGLMRVVTANNNDATTGGTITYTGDALSVAAGDWFIALPPTNFRWLGDIWNNSSSNLTEIGDLIFGKTAYLYTAADNWFCPLTWTQARVTGSAGGGGADSDEVGWYGNKGSQVVKVIYAPAAGVVYAVAIGTGGTTQSAPTAGGTTSLGALVSLSGGAAASAAATPPVNLIGLWGYGHGGDATAPAGLINGRPGFLLVEKV
jgi:hypothetical protein